TFVRLRADVPFLSHRSGRGEVRAPRASPEMGALTGATPSPDLSRKRERNYSRLALPGVIALAAFLRLFYLQYGQYGSDDERLWAQALRSVAALDLPTSGIRSSIGANNGPFQNYLMMPAAWLFGAAPIAGSILVALLNTAAVYFLYRLVEEF